MWKSLPGSLSLFLCMKFLRNLITCFFPKYISWMNLSLIQLVFNLFWSFCIFYNSEKYHHSIAKETKTFKQRIDHCTRVIFDYIIFFFSMSLVRRKHMEHSPQITKTLLKKTLWPLFMNGVQLPQGHSHFEEAVYFIPLSSQKFLELILSTSEGWKTESTLHCFKY